MHIFPMFLHVFWAGAPQLQKRCHSAQKMVKRGTGPFFVIFVAHSKAVPLCIKNEAEWHRAFFCRFCGAFKSGVTLHQK